MCCVPKAKLEHAVVCPEFVPKEGGWRHKKPHFALPLGSQTCGLEALRRVHGRCGSPGRGPGLLRAAELALSQRPALYRRGHRAFP